VYDFSFADARPVMLLSTAELGFSEEQVLTNPTMLSDDGRVLPRGSLELRRQRVVDGALEETLQVTNYNVFPVSFDVVYRFGRRLRRHLRSAGQRAQAARRAAATISRTDTSSSPTRGWTGVSARPSSASLPTLPPSTKGQVAFTSNWNTGQSASVRLLFAIDGHLKAPEGAERFVRLMSQYRIWMESATRMPTDNEFFNEVLARSLLDLRMLWHQENDRCYLAAGTPWFDTISAAIRPSSPCRRWPSTRTSRATA